MPEGRTVINNDNWTHIVGCTGLRQAHWQAWERKVAMGGGRKLQRKGKNLIFKRMFCASFGLVGF